MRILHTLDYLWKENNASNYDYLFFKLILFVDRFIRRQHQLKVAKHVTANLTSIVCSIFLYQARKISLRHNTIQCLKKFADGLCWAQTAFWLLFGLVHKSNDERSRNRVEQWCYNQSGVEMWAKFNEGGLIKYRKYVLRIASA